jgi:hypothetical protein
VNDELPQAGAVPAPDAIAPPDLLAGPSVAGEAVLDSDAPPITDAPSAEVGGGGADGGRQGEAAGGATASQLRRFIKSRPWVPMHELRRRFAIEGSDDEMSPIDLKDGRIFVGLPPRDAALLGDLIRQGEIGFELVHDPDCPAVAGVYPMRPVVRS